MDHQWDKPKSRPKNSQASGQIQAQATAFDEALAVWDFERSLKPTEDAAFSYARRQVTEPGYRLIGENDPAVNSSGYRSNLAYAAKPEVTSRPNRYNAGVKMVAGDTTPDPWDTWDEVLYKKMPVIGEVAAGRYDVTVAYHEPGSEADADSVFINTNEVKVNRTTFALRVRGQSMIENEIDDGDIVIVQAQDWADDGDFVIACLSDSSDAAGFVTLKRFYRHRQADRVVLQPANQSLNPIHILPHKGDAASEDLDAVKIQGRVTTIIKTNGL